jgi:hypothetical protein
MGIVQHNAGDHAACFLPFLLFYLTRCVATYDEVRATEDSFYSAGLVAVMCKSFLCAFEYSSLESSGPDNALSHLQ